MNFNERKRFAKEAGFKYQRDVKHGEFWVDDYGQIILLGKNDSDHRAHKNLMADIRTCVRKRPPAAPPVIMPPSDNWIEIHDKATALRAPLGQLAVIAPKVQKFGVGIPKGTKFMPKAEKRALVQRIQELKDAGKTHAQIAVILSVQGVKPTQGGPLTANHITTWLRQVTKSQVPVEPEMQPVPQPAPAAPVEVVEKPRAVAQGPAPDASDSLLLLETILKNSALTTEQKLRLSTKILGAP